MGESLELKLEDLRKLVGNLPNNLKHIGDKVFELAQKEGITITEYEKQMRQFPELKEKEKTRIYNHKVLLIALSGEEIVIRRNNGLAYI